MMFVQLPWSRMALWTQSIPSPEKCLNWRYLSSGHEATAILDFLHLSRTSECNFSY